LYFLFLHHPHHFNQHPGYKNRPQNLNFTLMKKIDFCCRETELFNHNDEYNVFFDHLIALVAESIAQIPV
jgi:hypothetical protein